MVTNGSILFAAIVKTYENHQLIIQTRESCSIVKSGYTELMSYLEFMPFASGIILRFEIPSYTKNEMMYERKVGKMIPSYNVTTFKYWIQVGFQGMVFNRAEHHQIPTIFVRYIENSSNSSYLYQYNQ